MLISSINNHHIQKKASRESWRILLVYFPEQSCNLKKAIVDKKQSIKGTITTTVTLHLL